jgi:hypothetical protein
MEVYQQLNEFIKLKKYHIEMLDVINFFVTG